MIETNKIEDLFFFHPKSKIKAGEGKNEGKFPFYTSSSILKKRIDKSNFSTRALVFGTGGSASLHFAEGLFSVSTDCLVVSNAQEELNIKYAYYYLKHNIHVLERGFKGAGLKHISKEYIKNIEISYPNLDVQLQVVTILDRVEELIDKRKNAIVIYDKLLRALFLDVFGDNAFNQKGWKRTTLEYICSKIIDCPHETPIYSDNMDDYYCIRSSDIQNNYVNLLNTKTVSKETYIKRINRHKPKANDVVYIREGGRLGNAARIPIDQKICLGQRMMLFVAKPESATNEFIWALLNSDSVKTKIKNISVGGAAPRINIGQLKSLEVFEPPFELQERFTKMVNKIDLLKVAHERSLAEMKNLLGSLTQRAFKGELISNIALDLEALLENDYNFFRNYSNADTIELLLEKISKYEMNSQKFHEQETYDKAKQFVFKLLEEQRIIQVYQKESNEIGLSLK